jgi:glycogen operon protein
MSEQDWREWSAKSFMLFLNGRTLRARGTRGERIFDDSFLLLFNAHLDNVAFTLPGPPWADSWVTEFDTSLEDPFAGGPATVPGGTTSDRLGLSLLVLRRNVGSAKPPDGGE